MAHTSTSEAEKPLSRKERARLGPLPGGGAAVLRVCIPVKVGGFTGQRDRWEEHERDYNVNIQGEKVVLKDTRDGAQIVFDRDGLAAALAVLEDYQA